MNLNSSKNKTNIIIFFDIDDTLFNTTKYHIDVRNFVFNILIKNGLKTTKDKLWEIFWKIYKQIGANANFHYNLILKTFNLQKTEFEKLKNIAILNQHKFRDEKLKDYIYKDVEKTLIKLNNSNFKLGVISSGIFEKQIHKLELLKIKNYFQENLIYIQLNKSEKFYTKIYQKTNKKYNTKNIYMIGDRENNDITPANKTGFKTIRIKGNGKYNNDFKNSNAKYKIEKITQILKII